MVRLGIAFGGRGAKGLAHVLMGERKWPKWFQRMSNLGIFSIHHSAAEHRIGKTDARSSCRGAASFNRTIREMLESWGAVQTA
jgi:hypothetical protein